MVVLKDLEVSSHERVVQVSDSLSGLLAIIAMHNTDLGPALGGTRIYPYPSFDEALTDALRLSEGMTYKAAAIEGNVGGGKSVILLDPKRGKTADMLRAFGRAVHRLGGKYICAEDVGCSVDDVVTIRQETPYVVGLPGERGGGDPSRFTAFGVYVGIQAVCKYLFDSPSVKGRTFAIQGLGSVGEKLASALFWEGAQLLVSDVDDEKLKRVSREMGAKIYPADQIAKQPCDVFVPCALGGVLNEKSIRQMRARAIAGAANNQLLLPSDAELLKRKNILYAPDFIINSGGLINVLCEREEGGYVASKALKHTKMIYDKLLEVFALAKQGGLSTHQAAVDIAKRFLKPPLCAI